MATRMLIDARHPEETRVAVLKGNRIDEFDFESADRKQLKGNIYLAKVTRVEPSLQAAFVDFGGNRHGFLAFSEIHPDYYQIPKEDREALLAEEAAHAAEEAELRAREEAEGIDEVDDEDDDEDDGGLTEVDTSEKDDISTIEDGQVENDEDAESEQAEVEDDATEGDASEDEVEASDGETEEETDDEENEADADEEAAEADEEKSNDRRSRRRGRRRQGRGRSKEADDLRARRMALRRRYKIQDVIQRRQVLLVQVVKEERGSKGAALTTYLSLAGRYCVLMPNSSHGGGISRKISSASDRKRLKGIINDLNLPKTMGCIVRTAGLSRTKTEIKRDFDYLARLWDELREKTLSSSAPSLIHSDSDLIKRAIRDIYNRDIEEVVVEGEDGYKAAKAFMKLLMPSHARRVKSYNDPVPLFQRYGAEDQLTAMYDPVVQLKSGGYIVINPTEALVSIDINSGRSTKEHGIEATAVNTNIEAAREIARQLRLRDMAGLVVIDFIDMDYNSNVRKVERAMKDALKSDRARIQVGRISSFGLMEMSRQRLRTGVLESTTRECPHCDGTGLVRTASSAGLSALRLIEDEAAKGRGSTISLFASTEAAVYLLNSKRSDLADIEARYGVSVEVIPEGEDEGAKMRAASSGPRNENMPEFAPIIDDDDDEPVIDEEDEDEESPRKKRRRRRGGRGRNRNRSDATEDAESEEDEDETEARDESSDDEDEAPKKRRRRGGRRRRGRGGSDVAADEGETEEASDESNENENADAAEASEAASEESADESAAETSEDSEEEPAPKRRSRRKKAETADEAEDGEASGSDDAKDEAEAEKPKRSRRKKAESADDDAADKPKARRSRRKKAEEPEAASSDDVETTEADTQTEADAEEPAAVAVASGPEETAEEPAAEQPVEVETAEASDEPPRRGWWQRTFGDE